MSTAVPRKSSEQDPAGDRVVRILHVEDSPLDAELVSSQLREGGLLCEICLVDREASFRDALQGPAPDLILADYSLPDFDGRSALEIAHKVCPEIPFLFVSGAIGEEQAIETLKAGAVDYVLKQRLDRLVPSVRRALQEADDRILRRRAEESLRQSEERLRRARDELEARVCERTQELAQANAALCVEVAERKKAETELRRVNKALRILSECNQIVARSPNEDHLLGSICHVAVEFGGYGMVWIGEARHDRQQTVHPLGCAGCERIDLEQARVTWGDTDRGQGPVGRAIRTGRAVIHRNMAERPEFAPWRDEVLRRHWTVAMAVPMVVEGRIFGAMSFYSTEADAFDDAEVRLLQELADDVSFGLSALRARAERQRALEALQASEQQYRRIVETAEEGIWVLDEADSTLFINQKMAGMLGYTVEEMLGTSVLSYVDERDRQPVEESLKCRRAGIKDAHDVRFRTRDGAELWVILAGSPIFDEAGQYQGALKMATDITERKRLEGSVTEVSTLEQQRIGRDLHDVLGQNLTGISFLTKILEQKLQAMSVPEAQDAAEIGRLASLTNKQVRSLARGLSPVELTAANFEAKIKEFAAGVQEIFGISCACECGSRVHVFDAAAAMHLYRIAQEAVNNAVKHGKARNIMIQLAEQAGKSMLIVQDDGRGLPKDSEKHNGMGLRIMSYRASAIGGTLRIRAKGDSGTVVVCTWGEPGH
jgi:PAS domain S-box-containing protein